MVPAEIMANPILRGLRGRCPNCGEGRMFARFLKVADQCPSCGEELHHQRADDFPAYLVLFIAGHLLIPVVLGVEEVFEPALWVHAALWIPATLILCVGLLQPVKGAVVGLQWKLGMHGFEEAKKLRSPATVEVV